MRRHKLIIWILVVINISLITFIILHNRPHKRPKIVDILNIEGERASEINFLANNPNAGPGDPYPFEGKQNPFLDLLKSRGFNQNADSNKSKNNFLPKATPSSVKGLLFGINGSINFC